MSIKQKKQTICLLVVMVVCVILTSLIFTKSIPCEDCGDKITGKYYITLSERIYCEDCGKEYYLGFPGDLDNVTDKVNNTIRNVLVALELIGFIGAIVVINKKKSEGTIKTEAFPSFEKAKEEPAKYCANCGASILAGAKFCPSCGAPKGAESIKDNSYVEKKENTERFAVEEKRVPEENTGNDFRPAGDL